MLKRMGAISLLALMVGAMPVLAQPTGEAPRWLRYASISPDGETISFTYRGQIFVVPSDGGLAVPLTGNGHYSHAAVWAPDSESLAFASNLNGSDDIYITDFSGTLNRMSWSARSEVPNSFSADGKTILFNSLGLGDAERSVQGALSSKPQLYAVDLATGRETLVLPNYAIEAQWNGGMDKLVYTYDPAGDADIRQHRVVANARQLYIFDPVSGHHQRLFSVDGKDRHNPLWSADGTGLIYLSEASGTLNVWSHLLGSDEEVQLTFFRDSPVKDLSIADDGTIAFIADGRIHTMTQGASEPQAISITTLDQRANIDENVRVLKSDQFVSSPDGEHFAMTALGNVFVMDRAGNYRQVTSTPEEERDIAFSPDGSTLVYASQRDHQWGLYGVQLRSDADATPMTARLEEQVFYVPEQGNAFQPQFSPDGEKLGFVADRREVQVLALETQEISVLFQPEDYNSSYVDGDQWFAWSPTSQDLLVMWQTLGATGPSHAAIVPADGSTRPVMMTQSLPDFSRGGWSIDGSQIMGLTSLFSNRTAQLHGTDRDLYRIFLSEEARQDFLDIVEGFTDAAEVGPQRYTPQRLRSERLEARLVDGNVMYRYPLPDGVNMVVVTEVGETTYAIGLMNLVSGETSLLQQIEAPELTDISHVADANILDFRISGAVISVPVFNPDQVQTVPLRVFTTYNPQRQRAAAFEQVWADINYHFYSSALEGRDWGAIGAQYRNYLGSIATDREFADLIRAMFGELSASHLFSQTVNTGETTTGLGTHNDVLGVYLDYGYTGPGRRVAAILPGGPLDRSGLEIEAGDIIMSINGVDVPEAGGLERLLDVNLGKTALLGVQDADGAEARIVPVTPVGAQQEQVLASQRWRDARRELVDRLSNGCVAYQYVSEMSNEQYLGVLGTLSGSREITKAAIVDIRSNGGGNLTRELMTLLSGTAYGQVGRENGPWAADPNNRWLAPSAVLVDSFSYSDATIFPQAYQDAGVGLLVGDTFLNTGTYRSENRSRILPGYYYYMPILPVRRMDGSFYENNVVEPDIAVSFDPNTAGIGVDPQLEAAVAALMKQVGADSSCR